MSLPTNSSNELSLKGLLQKNTNLNENANQYPAPISYLRKLSGQEKDLNIVEVDHNYNKPWNRHPDSGIRSRAARFLFMDNFPKHFFKNYYDRSFNINNLQVVNADTPRPEDNPFIKEAIQSGVKVTDFEPAGTLEFEEDLQMPANQANWSPTMYNLYSGAIDILNSDRLTRSSYVNRENELILRRNLTEKTSSKFRYLYAATAPGI